ncbi:hypothetical protein ACWD6P_20980 [Streptomyces sp. NPDC002446]
MSAHPEMHVQYALKPVVKKIDFVLDGLVDRPSENDERDASHEGDRFKGMGQRMSRGKYEA